MGKPTASTCRAAESASPLIRELFSTTTGAVTAGGRALAVDAKVDDGGFSAGRVADGLGDGVGSFESGEPLRGRSSCRLGVRRGPPLTRRPGS